MSLTAKVLAKKAVFVNLDAQAGAKVLTQADLTEIYETAQQQDESICQQSDFEIRAMLPPVLGQGGDHILQLRGGLTLHIRSGTLRQPIRIKQQHDPEFPLVAKFYLSGASQVQTQRVSNVQTDYVECTGCNYLYYLPDLTEIEEWRADEQIQVVMVYAYSDYFESFNANHPLIHSMQQRFHQSLGKTTPAMQQVLQQVLHCPYEGLTQQLYLESKALELLTLQFAVWKDNPVKSAPLTLRSDDIERLHHAREILLQCAAHPPSLIELAHQVGLNDRKLKQGFRQLFGTTVFGYLHDYRMQQAQQLLRQPYVSVAQVAAQVGYRNPEAFGTAFRRKFAVTPKAYQLGQRG